MQPRNLVPGLKYLLLFYFCFIYFNFFTGNFKLVSAYQLHNNRHILNTVVEACAIRFSVDFLLYGFYYIEIIRIFINPEAMDRMAPIPEVTHCSSWAIPDETKDDTVFSASGE